MASPATRMARREAPQPLGAVAGQDAEGSGLALRLVAAIQDLRDRAARERATGSDAVAAYMLGRGSRWPKAWLKRAMRERGEEHGELEYDFDGR